MTEYPRASRNSSVCAHCKSKRTHDLVLWFSQVVPIATDRDLQSASCFSGNYKNSNLTNNVRHDMPFQIDFKILTDVQESFVREQCNEYHFRFENAQNFTFQSEFKDKVFSYL
jgi:hypothetical protein